MPLNHVLRMNQDLPEAAVARGHHFLRCLCPDDVLHGCNAMDYKELVSPSFGPLI